MTTSANAVLDTEIDKFYSKSCLVSLAQTYFKPWQDQGWITSVVPESAKTAVYQGIGKQKYQKIIKQLYTDPVLFQRAYQSFSPALKRAIFEATWHGGSDIPTLEREFGFEIVQRTAGSYRSIPSEAHSVLLPEFRLLQYAGPYYSYSSWYGSDKARPFTGALILPDSVRSLLKQSLPKPENYILHAVHDADAAYEHATQDETLAQLDLYLTYVAEGHIEHSEKSGKITAKSLKLMRDYCHISEFYAETELATVKTGIIAGFLLAGLKRTTKPAQANSASVVAMPEEHLRSLFNQFIEDSRSYSLFNLLLPHIKGVSFREQSIGQSWRTLLLALPRDTSWVSMQNCLDYATFRELNFDLADRWNALNSLFVTKADGWGYNERVYFTAQPYYRYLTVPLCKSLFGLGAAFGLVDIAYNVPRAKPDFITKNAFITPFDEIKYVRLTPLGRYCLGLDDTFQSHQTVETGEVILDSYDLIVTISGEHKIGRLILDKAGRRLDEHRYEITYESLFKDCRSAADIKQKIQFFKQNISTPLPPHWEAFFDCSLRQINPLDEELGYLVLKLKPDAQLAAFVATDEILKRYIVKAEGYRILVERHDRPAVLARLAQAGYFSE